MLGACRRKFNDLYAMGWSGGHLHEFVIGEEHYGQSDPDFDMGPPLQREDRVTLATWAHADPCFTSRLRRRLGTLRHRREDPAACSPATVAAMSRR